MLGRLQGLPRKLFSCLIKTMDPKLAAKFADDPLFRAVMEESLSIQDRFSAEPVYAKTGKGRLKSAGVTELQEIKAAASRKKKSKAQ